MKPETEEGTAMKEDSACRFRGTVNWSSDLAALADSLLEQLRQIDRTGTDPFEKNCIVVNSPATEKWLKQYFLLERKVPQVLLNLDFVMLPEFVNDWLWSAVSGKHPRERRAGQHPYSKDILTWRIFRILKEASPDGEFRELLEYVGDQKNCALKRWRLSERLAALYDDYLNSRFQLLRRWEKGESSGCDVPSWQIALYRKLVSENAGTYAAEYEQVLQDPGPAAAGKGFPRYRSVHVFDIPFIPDPTLQMLERIAETLPLMFWNFNPLWNWLAETPSSGEAARQLRAHMKKALKETRSGLKSGGELPDGIRMVYNSPEERLLGALGSGARGVISALCSDSGGNIEVAGVERDTFGLEDLTLSVHSVYSPRRELEAVRDGLHEFFRTHPDAAPHEALVLCADWETYAPVIDLVFPPLSGAEKSPEGYIPVSTESIPGGSLIVQSFEELLGFRKNRFELSAVFSLLNVPAVRSRYGLDQNAVEILREMAGTANIHWGADDGDVRRILGLSPDPEGAEKGKANPFTWRCGFDRLTAELFYGFDAEKTLIDAGDAVGELHPCGHVEGERAVCVAALWSLVEDLAELRTEKLPEGQIRPVKEICDSLLWIADTFYDESEDKRMELNDIRRAARKTAGQLETAGLTEIEDDVFIQAVSDSMKKPGRGRRNSADSVLFAPLNCYTATPRKFIWICGLNDGVFPRMDSRAAYDLIGRRPSLFDASLREQDAFALLKATLCAREQLSYSYIGRDIRTNEPVPPTVLLDDLIDYFRSAGIPFSRYEHPLQGYSRCCFRNDGKLPPSYSGMYRKVAETLASQKEISLTAFPLSDDGVTEIDLEDLILYFADPGKYLLGKFDAAVPWFRTTNDSECIETKLARDLRRTLALEELSDSSKELEAKLSVESGHAPDMASACGEMDSQSRKRLREIEFKKARRTVYSCRDQEGNGLIFAEAYRLPMQEEEKGIELTVRGKVVRIRSKIRTVRLKALDRGEEKESDHSLLFFDDLSSDSVKNEIRLRHLAANAAKDGNVTTVAFSTESKIGFRALPGEQARHSLTILLELATGPLPPGHSGFGKNDGLPEEWQKVFTDAAAKIE